MHAFSSRSRHAGRAAKFGARLLKLNVPFLVALGGAGIHGCGGEEFCAQGSYECSNGGSAGTSSAGSSAAGTGATGGDGFGATGSAGSAAASAGFGAGSSAEGGGAGVGEDVGGSDGGAGEGGAGGADQGPAPCDSSALEAGCVVSEDGGIFVSAVEGNDDRGDGTQAAPFETLGAAIEHMASLDNPLPIYVCKATYREQITVATDDAEIHGGFACPKSAGPWVFDPTERPRLAPTSRGVVLKLQRLEGFALSDLEIAAVAAVDAGESSVAVVLDRAMDVTFTRVSIVAGNGKDGTNATRREYTYPDAEKLGGNNATGPTGGVAQNSCLCPGPTGNPKGGAGGNGGLNTIAGGKAGSPELGGGAGGLSGAQCNAGGAGGDGANALKVDDGRGAQVHGAISTDMGWKPRDGEPGQPGGPGQGGGGGTGALGLANAGGGGGGACGGCGGRAGDPGGGGGASIGVVALDSSITLESCEIQTGDAGDGGRGAVGQEGQIGGAHGNGTGMGCQGGNGGTGAGGGAGGGGAGGISVGVLWDGGREPVLSGSTDVDYGNEGAGGPGAGADGNDGIAGIAMTIVNISEL